jgi:tetratricopeptide (TPR) repeat protein
MTEPLSPKQLENEGKAAYQRGDFSAAARAFQAAAQGFASTGDVLTSAEMSNNVSVALLQAGDAPAALEAVEPTPAIFAEAGDVRRQAMALGNRAAALEASKRFDEAAEAYEQSAELFKQIGEDGLRANVLQSLSALQLRTGRQLQALASMQAGLEQIERPTPQQSLLKRLLRVPFHMLGK